MFGEGLYGEFVLADADFEAVEPYSSDTLLSGIDVVAGGSGTRLSAITVTSGASGTRLSEIL